MPIIEDRDTFLDMLESKPIKRIASHGDADGISAAYMAALWCRSKKMKPEVYFPKAFKETKTISGKEADLVLDKVPDPSYIGSVIDHHPDHLPTSNYALWLGNVPASLLALELFKDDIPESLWWKAAPGIVGDGQSQKIPAYLWKRFPHLLEQVATVRKWSGKTNIYKNPVWFLLSSPINSACRVGKKNLAFSRLVAARNPIDLVFDPQLQECKSHFNKEVDRVRMEHRAIDLGEVEVWVVDSNYSVNSTLAWELNSKSRKTVLVMNTNTRHGSIRGVLVDYLKEHMPKKWGIGGHSGFAGFSFPPVEAEGDALKSLEKLMVNEFIDDLRSVLRW